MFKLDTTKEFQLLDGVLINIFDPKNFEGHALNEYLPMFEDSIKMSGGAAAGVVDFELMRGILPEAVMDAIEKYYIAKDVFSLIDKGSRTFAVMIHVDTVNYLTVDELTSVIYHEFGHIKLGHGDSVLKETSVEEMRKSFEDKSTILSTEISREIEADNYAMERVSPAVLKKALLKLMEKNIREEHREGVMNFHQERFDNIERSMQEYYRLNTYGYIQEHLT